MIVRGRGYRQLARMLLIETTGKEVDDGCAGDVRCFYGNC